MIYERTEKLKHSDTVRCASHSGDAASLSLVLSHHVSVCVSVSLSYSLSRSLCVCVSLCFCPAEGIAVCFSFSTTAVAVAVAVAAVAIVCAAAAAALLPAPSLFSCICWTLSSSGTKRWYHGRQPYRRLQPRRRGKWPPGHVLCCCCFFFLLLLLLLLLQLVLLPPGKGCAQPEPESKLDSGVAFQYLWLHTHVYVLPQDCTLSRRSSFFLVPFPIFLLPSFASIWGYQKN